MIKQFIISIFILVLLASCGTRKASQPVAPEKKQLVELSDMFQTGHARFVEAVQEDSLIKVVWRDHASKVVMVLIDIEYEDGEKEQVQQSGILVGGNQLVLTAGHGFIVDEGKVVATRIVAGKNREVAVTLAGLSYIKHAEPLKDWAILKPLYDLNMEAFPLAERRAAYSEQVLVLGFPGALGLNRAGIVERVDRRMMDPKGPLGIICDRQRFDRFTLKPVAGSIPVRGISGAPVFNSQGELIGLFSSMGRRRYGESWEYIFEMSEIPWVRIRELEGK